MAGTKDCKNIYIFDPSKKITRIECIIDKDEWEIIRINFYHYEERLVKVGYSDGYVKLNGVRREMFNIAED